MGVFFTVLYIGLSLLSPADIFPEIGRYRVMLIMAALLTLGSIPVYLSFQLVSRISRQFILVVLFFGWMMAIWIPLRWWGGPLDTFIHFSPAIITYFFAIAHLRSPARLHFFRVVMVLVSFYILAMGFSQYRIASATHTDMPYALVWGSDIEGPPRLRGLGPLNDPNDFGQCLLIQLPLLFVSNKKEGNSFGRLFAFLIASVYLFGIYLTGSRGTLLGFILLLGLYLRERFKTMGTIIGVVFGLLGVLVYNIVGRRQISVSGGLDRLALWSDGLGMLRHSPIWGSGMKSFGDNVGLNAHNAYLLCAVEGGLVGLFLWTAAILVSIRQLQVVSASGKPNPGEKAGDPVIARWGEAVKKSFIIYLFTAYFLSDTFHMLLYVFMGLAGAIFYMYTDQPGRNAYYPFRNWPVQAFAFAMTMIFLVWAAVHTRAI